jgi:hypothetical protein
MTANTMMQPAGIGSGIAAPAGCGCGGTGCPVCQGEVFVRPRFFAGQLLTEDDLQSLGDYVVAKNRLHMRHLFGSGVVCGLMVTCEPCGGGKIVVNPGYALDCCGNDIVVACPQTLDVNVMVRELLLKLRGADCGDPCAGAAAEPAAGGRRKGKPVGPPARRYCLYVDYCQELADPVAPYATGDPCGQAVCEATRLREGFRFELRCPEDEDCLPEICRRLWGCIGEPVAAKRVFADAEFLRGYGARLLYAAKASRAAPAPPLPDDYDYWARLDEHTAALHSALHDFEGLHVGEDAVAASLRRVLRAVLDVAAGLARFWVQPAPQTDDHTKSLRDAATALQHAGREVTRDIVERELATTLPRVHAHALIEAARHLAEETGRRLQPPPGGRVRALAPIDEIATRYLAEHVVFSGPIVAAAVQALRVQRDWLVVQLDRQPVRTRCALPKEVGGTALPAPQAEPDHGTAELLGGAAGTLCRAVREVLRDCLCNALNPPCPDCDDPAVLLACLVVEDCEVTEICNLEREFVLSGPAIRYWLPELARRGKALERWCCPSREECEEEEMEYVERDDRHLSIRSVFGSVPEDVEHVLSVIFEACPPQRDAKPAPTALLGFAARQLPARPEAAADAALGGIVDRVRAEMADEFGRLRDEIDGLRAENARLAARIARPARRAPRQGGGEGGGLA